MGGWRVEGQVSKLFGRRRQQSVGRQDSNRPPEDRQSKLTDTGSPLPVAKSVTEKTLPVWLCLPVCLPACPTDCVTDCLPD